jgi:hypothetical protein
VALQQEMANRLSWKSTKTEKKPSLAQKLGLVEGPKPPLTKEEWDKIESNAVKRNHVQEPCPICMDYFSFGKQIILDCSHIFHVDCFTNFEKFVKQQKEVKLSCPLCRKERYKKKYTTQGSKAYLNKSATIIQSLWRGYKTRKMYRKVLLDKQPKKKLEYYARKLNILSDKLILYQSMQEKAVNYAISLSDYNLQKSKLSFLSNEEWEDIIEKAKIRNPTTCPICMCSLFSNKKSDNSIEKHCIVTSCGHCFHGQCISSFEIFSPLGRTFCPLCRSSYLKREYN